MDHAPPDAPADASPAPAKERVALQLRKLVAMSEAGAAIARQLTRQATDAKWFGADGAVTFSRIARAVRQTIVMEIRLSSFDPARSERQLAALTAISEVGVEAIERLRAQILDRNWVGDRDGIAFARLATATRMTIALEARILGELEMTAAERAAAQAKRDAVWRQRHDAQPAGKDAGAGSDRTAQPDDDSPMHERSESLQDQTIECELGDLRSPRLPRRRARCSASPKRRSCSRRVARIWPAPFPPIPLPSRPPSPPPSPRPSPAVGEREKIERVGWRICLPSPRPSPAMRERGKSRRRGFRGMIRREPGTGAVRALKATETPGCG